MVEIKSNDGTFQQSQLESPPPTSLKSAPRIQLNDNNAKRVYHKPEIRSYAKGKRLKRNQNQNELSTNLNTIWPSTSSLTSNVSSTSELSAMDDNNESVPPTPPPMPTPSSSSESKKQHQEDKIQEADRSTAKSSSPTTKEFTVDNEIKSLEKCETISLDIVDDKFPWDHCTGYALSSNPEAAVFFIQVPDFKRDFENLRWKVPQVLVVKATLTIIEELFGLYVADWFQLQTPQMQLIEKFPRTDLTHPELDGENKQRVGYHWKSIRDTLKRMAMEDDHTAVDLKVQKDLGSSLFYLLMEFMSGAQPLDDLDESMLMDPEGCTKWLTGIGRMVVVDIILNNWDRIPAIWDNHGNAGNVLIGTEDDEIYAIDQAVTCINEKDQADYLDRVKHFIQDHHQSKDNVDSSAIIQTILNFVKNPFASMEFEGIKRDIGITDHEAKLAIWKGIDISLQMAQKLSMEELSKIKIRIDQMKTGKDNAVANEYWKKALDSTIDLNFIYHIVQIMQQPHTE